MNIYKTNGYKAVCKTFKTGVIAAAIFIVGCAVNPVTGKKELSLLSTEAEIALGEEHYLASQQSGGGQYGADAKLTAYVDSVGQKLARVSDRELPYEFVVLNSGVPNAWALPGGKIAINRGLLVELENEAELAAVLGHEIVHAAAKHGAKAWQRGLLGEVIQVAVAHAAKDSADADYAVGGAAVALGLVGQKYGRDAERMSDYHGMKYMHAAGYDPSAAVTLQEKFVALSKGKKRNWLEGLFASHPPSAERVALNRKTLAEFPAGGILGRARYQKATAHLREHKQAYAQADRARSLINKDARAALAAIQSAIRDENKEPLFHGIKGHILARQNNYRAAIRAYNTAIQIGRHQYYEYFLGRGLIYQKLGRDDEAKRDLAASYKLLPTASAAYGLGLIALQNDERQTAKQFFKNAGEAKDGIGQAARMAFVKLDVADAPWRYVETEILFDNNQVVVRATNSAPVALRNITIQVQADINGERVVRRRSIAQLASKASTIARSGIYYRDADQVEAGAKILRAQTN